jgi:hypothetical protein
MEACWQIVAKCIISLVQAGEGFQKEHVESGQVNGHFENGVFMPGMRESHLHMPGQVMPCAALSC